MKKKILLALTLVAVFVCLFAISISAEDMTQYVEFKVQLEGGADYISVYQPNTKNNPELYFSNDFFTKLDKSEKIEDKTTIVKIDLSDAKAVGVNNSYIGVLGAGSSSDFINVTEIKFPNRAGFTTIGAKFCMGWTSLETVDFGCATTIKNNAFNGCTSLKEITIPANVTYIETNLCDGCTGLTKATILGNAELLSSAFKNCTSLTEVSIENVKYISNSAFYGCTSLTSITLPKNASKIDSHAFNGAGITSITIPASVTSIGEKAFLSSTVLTSVTFEPNSQLTYIGPSAFSGCTGITGAFDFSNVTEFASSAFYGCTGITSINAPKVKKVGSSAFKNCTGLQEITTTSELTNISDNAFEGCTVLTGTFDLTNLTEIRNNAFKNCSLVQFGDFTLPSLTYFGNGVFINCDGITSIVLPEGITAITGSTFSGCDNLKSVTLPSTVERFDGNSFDGCVSLENVIFTYNYEKYPEHGSAFTKVGNGQVFRNCSSLKTLIFPNSLTHIDNSTFSGCTSLETLVLGASFSSVNQVPSIPSTVKSLVLSETYMIDARLFAWDTNKFTRPTSFVMYYTGTKAQAETLQTINVSCWEVSHSTLVSYEEFTSESFVRDENVHYMVYGYNKCEAFYKGEHNKSEVESKFLGQDYVTNFVNASTCTRCALEFIIGEPICGPLFDDLGYSTEDEGTAFAYAIIVNSTNIDKYIEATGDTLVYGFIVGLYAENSTGDIINANGEAQIANSLVLDFTEPRYDNLNRFELKFTNITNAELGLYCNAYVINDTDVSYIGAVTEDYKAQPITFAKLPKKDEE